MAMVSATTMAWSDNYHDHDICFIIGILWFLVALCGLCVIQGISFHKDSTDVLRLEVVLVHQN